MTCFVYMDVIQYPSLTHNSLSRKDMQKQVFFLQRQKANDMQTGEEAFPA